MIRGSWHSWLGMACAVGLTVCAFSCVQTGTVGEQGRSEAVTSASAAPQHLLLARELLRDVGPDATSYRHTRAEVRWAGDGAPVCHADCSSFMSAVFQRAMRADDAAIGAWLGRARPRAREYFAAIDGERGFERVATVPAIRPGDVIAIRYEAGASNTGHVMFVNSEPQKGEKSLPRVEGATCWEIDVIDCSASGHGPGDSRLTSDGAFGAGLGRGTLRVYTDDSGCVIGHAFTISATSPFRPVAQRPLVVGRFRPSAG